MTMIVVERKPHEWVCLLANHAGMGVWATGRTKAEATREARKAYREEIGGRPATVDYLEPERSGR